MQENGLSSMVRLTHTLLKGSLTQAVKWQMIAQNPADYVDLPKRKPAGKARALSRLEVASFLESDGPVEVACVLSAHDSDGLTSE